MKTARSAALDSLAWEAVNSLVHKRVVDGSSMTLTRYSFQPGGGFPHHVHDQEQITMVVAGRLTFVAEGVDHVLEQGSVIVIPSGLPHSAEAGPDGAEVVSVVSPARTEGRGMTMLEEG